LAATLNNSHFFQLYDFENWMLRLRSTVEANTPELLSIFDVFSNEALFGRRWLESSVNGLDRGASILEVGGGLMLLSCQLAREGFFVQVLEPIGMGFSSFAKLQAIVLAFAEEQGISLRVIPEPVEQLRLEGVFDFAFSINVMEHIDSVPDAIERVCRSLKPGKVYRFTCPNYSFPYEPHFNIPTFFSKWLTLKIMRRKIYYSVRVAEPGALWQSLNWINVHQIKKICTHLPDISVFFDTGMFNDALTRIRSDAAYAKRRGPWINAFAVAIVRLKLNRLVKFLPPEMLPVLDCAIRTGNAKGIFFL
jgi:2-polyprenyl-3-methyl-5-hydroxy-6-metoxy-1,4-benzoquinol methylase